MPKIHVDGITLEAKFIGKGHYCRAYRYNDTVYCFVVEGEYMKEALRFADQSNAHIPTITEHKDNSGPRPKVYSMPFYPTIKAADKPAWQTFKTLEAIRSKLFYEKYCGKLPLMYHGCYYNRDIITESFGKVPYTVTQALESLADAAGLYGAGVAFEFGKRNIGVDTNGNIVFRDILFDAEKLYKQYTRA